MFYDSTQPLPAPQKHQFWNDAVCKRLIPAVAEFEDRASFEGSLTGHKVGSLTICEMASSPHTFVRTAQKILLERSSKMATSTKSRKDALSWLNAETLSCSIRLSHFCTR